MPFIRTYTVPDYYIKFKCKGSTCRRTCCQGWRVTLSFSEYYKLLGMNCSKRLRKILDVAFEEPDYLEPERYRIIKPNWKGCCPMLSKEGLCNLHKECGEDALPGICRYYPRAVRRRFADECSCTNSCERVLEMLFASTDKLTFGELDLTFNSDAPVKPPERETKELYLKTRTFSAEILRRREINLAARLYALGKFLEEADAVNCYSEIDVIMEKHRAVVYPALKEEESGFGLQRKIAEWFEENSPSLMGYGEIIERAFGGDDGSTNYALASERFSQIFPDWEIMFEKMLLNHLFYEQFPFVEGFSMRDSFTALAAVYAFLRYVALGYTFYKAELDDLIDVLAAAFRVIEHSAFYKKVNLMLRSEDKVSADRLVILLTR